MKTGIRPVVVALAGRTLGGERFDLAQQRGRVVLLFFWDGGCSVCLSKLPELRANAEGWAGRPFDLVTVNVDQTRDPAVACEQARQAPTLVIDREGREVLRVEGRVPPTLWNEIAALLP